MKLFSVPNLLSLGNLLCGCIAIFNVIDGNIGIAAYLVMLACVFDFLDGFAARGLKQGSPMGKELDSLADMVTFGVVPGMVMFQLIRFNLVSQSGNIAGVLQGWKAYLPYAGFVIPAFSALRLAKFNVDTRQTGSFIGLPTLANALFICGIPFVFRLDEAAFTGTTFVAGGWTAAAWNSFADIPAFIISTLHSPWMLIATAMLFSVLLVSPLPMFSFKIRSVQWKGNEARYIFLALAVALGTWLKLAALPPVIVVYIALSATDALRKRNSQQAQ